MSDRKEKQPSLCWLRGCSKSKWERLDEENFLALPSPLGPIRSGLAGSGLSPAFCCSPCFPPKICLVCQIRIPRGTGRGWPAK